MKMIIHSSFGVLDCEPMTLQAIDKSISEEDYREIPQSDSDALESSSGYADQLVENSDTESPF